MDKFAISSDDCLILKAFKDSNSLREAAHLLGCDPAGLARRVQNISSTHGFLQKVNNRWQLSSRGLDLVAWTESSIQTQKKILSAKSSLRIATTMWFSEEVLIPHLEKLRAHLGGKMQFSLSVPTKGFELALIDGSVDFVIVCHPPENPEIEHRQLGQEKWALIAPRSWKKDLNLRSDKVIEQLKKLPFIRHHDINEDIFLPDFGEMHESGIAIDNLIGIRTAVMAGLGWSIVPRLLVERHIKEGSLLEIPYDLPIQDRKVCVWWLRNRYDTRTQSSKLCAWVKEIC
jgi:DNA-binding transcriptional LysR family regulator